jgi:hypothetical protein
MCITARFLLIFCSSESSGQKELLFDQHFVVVSKATYEEHMSIPSILLGGLTTFLAWWQQQPLREVCISSRRAPRFCTPIRPISIQNSSLRQSEEFHLQS